MPWFAYFLVPLKSFLLCATFSNLGGAVFERPTVTFDEAVWRRTCEAVAPGIFDELLKRGITRPGLLDSFTDESPDERSVSIGNLLGRKPTVSEVFEWDELLSVSSTFASCERSRTINALTDPSKRALVETDTKVSLDTESIMRCFKHKRKDEGWIPRSSAKKAVIPEKTLRSQWVKAAIDLLMSTGLPMVQKLQLSSDPQSLAQHLCGGLRCSTLKRKVQEARKLQNWMLSTFDVPWPQNVVQVLDYLIDRAGEPCAASIPGTIINALHFIERMGGVKDSDSLASDMTIKVVVKDLVVDLKTAAGVKERKKAPPLLLAIIVGLEAIVVCCAVPIYLRIYAWWRLIRCWGGLRWSDCKFMPPHLARYDETGLTCTITQTKVTGPGKKTELIYSYISSAAWILHQDWLESGWNLFQRLGFDSRDFWLPNPSSDLNDYAIPWREQSYLDSSGLSRKLFSMIQVYERVPNDMSSVIRCKLDINGDPIWLFREGAQVFFTEHSDRATLATWGASMNLPKETIDGFGHWGARGSDDYVRCTRTLTLAAQKIIAEAIRSGSAPSKLGEEDTLRRLNDFLERRGLDQHVVDDIVKHFGQVWPSTDSHQDHAVPPGVHIAPADSEEEEDQCSKAPRSQGTPESLGSRSGPADRSDDEGAAVAAGQWVISREKQGKHRTLHRVGLCYRIPGVHYYFYDLVSEVQVRNFDKDRLGKVCKDCFRSVNSKASRSSSSRGDEIDSNSDESTSDSSV